jgi:hypothetical protein
VSTPQEDARAGEAMRILNTLHDATRKRVEEIGRFVGVHLRSLMNLVEQQPPLSQEMAVALNDVCNMLVRGLCGSTFYTRAEHREIERLMDDMQDALEPFLCPFDLYAAPDSGYGVAMSAPSEHGPQEQVRELLDSLRQPLVGQVDDVIAVVRAGVDRLIRLIDGNPGLTDRLLAEIIGRTLALQQIFAENYFYPPAQREEIGGLLHDLFEAANGRQSPIDLPPDADRETSLPFEELAQEQGMKAGQIALIVSSRLHEGMEKEITDVCEMPQELIALVYDSFLREWGEEGPRQPLFSCSVDIASAITALKDLGALSDEQARRAHAVLNAPYISIRGW